MVTNSDLEKWQAVTNGINGSGQQDLNSEEWSALVTLNNSLQNSNFMPDESRRALVLLKNNLSQHSNNQVLQTHLQDFIALCEQYVHSTNTPVVTPTIPTVNANAQPAETANPNTDKPKAKSSKNLILIIILLVIGYLVYTHLNISGWSGLDGRYTLANTIGIGSVPENIIISGDNFTLEYDYFGTKIDKSAKFKYKDGKITFTEGNTSLSFPCELRNGSLWFQGVEYKKTK